MQHDPALTFERSEDLAGSTFPIEAALPGVKLLLLGREDTARFIDLTFEAPHLLFCPTTDRHVRSLHIAIGQFGTSCIALELGRADGHYAA
jgi:hypothetical protein